MAVTADGDVYHGFTEGIADELVENWVKDRWQIFKRMAVIIIEKQMMRPGSYHISDRACIVVETCLKMLFRREKCAPPFVVLSPKTWKKFCGIALQGSHLGNKSASIARARRVIGEEQWAKLCSVHGTKMDDIADVYNMLDYGTSYVVHLRQVGLTRRNHNLNVFDGTTKPRVYKTERIRPWVHLDDPYIKGCELLSVNEANFQRRKHKQAKLVAKATRKRSRR